jgi:hypothetical protein
VAADLARSEQGAFPESLGEAAGRAQAWVRNSAERSRHRICADPTVKVAAESDDLVDLMNTLATIVAMPNIIAAKTIVVLLIARMVLRGFCSDEWKNGGRSAE